MLGYVSSNNIVDPAATLNNGRVVWGLSLPGKTGGRYLYNLANPLYKTDLHIAATKSSWSRGLTLRPGGLGCLYCPSTAYIDFGNVVPFNGATKLTMACWMYKGNGGTGSAAFSRDGSPGASRRVGIYWWTDANAYFIMDTSTQYTITLPMNSFGHNRWHHFAMVFQTGSVIQAYLNGVNVTSLGTSSGTPNTAIPTASTNLTANRGNEGNLGPAYYDDFGVWTRALSDGEIFGLYNASRTGYRHELNWLTTQMIGYYQLSQLYSRFNIFKGAVFGE